MRAHKSDRVVKPPVKLHEDLGLFARPGFDNGAKLLVGSRDHIPKYKHDGVQLKAIERVVECRFYFGQCRFDGTVEHDGLRSFDGLTIYKDAKKFFDHHSRSRAHTMIR